MNLTQPSSNIRRQASLYLHGFPEVERLRQRFNPAQAKLIPAHVTLCREDEVLDWAAFEARVLDIIPIELAIQFSEPVREGNLVYLPATESTDRFDMLRHALLNDDLARKHQPHLTIIHPRNGVCTDEIFEEIRKEVQPFNATFREISLIQQIDGGVWNQLAVYK